MITRKLAARAASVVLVLAVVAVVATACLDRELQPLNPCLQTNVTETVSQESVDAVDILFVIDKSRSMTEEQQELADKITQLVTPLAEGEFQGEQFEAVESMHIGVITTDLMNQGAPFQTNDCTCDPATSGECPPAERVPTFGDNAELQQRPGSTAPMSCNSMFPKFLEFQAGDDPAMVSNNAGCLASVGTKGCGFEMQLESALKAVTPSNSDLRFKDGTPNRAPDGTKGQGSPDGFNAGFLREDSLLSVILVSDEDDCSVKNLDLLKSGDSPWGEVANSTRCTNVQNPPAELQGNFTAMPIEPSPSQPSEARDGALYPVQRYVEGLLALRDNPDRLLFAAIVGVPTEIEDQSFEDILAADSMQFEPSPDPIEPVVPSCERDTDGDGTVDDKAFPPRRIVKVAQLLDARGSNGVVTSICRDNFAPAIATITDKLKDLVTGACLPRSLNRNSQGLVNCDVVEILPPGMSCAEIDGDNDSDVNRTEESLRTQTDAQGNEREVCGIAQLSVDPDNPQVPSGAGWYYDDFSTAIDKCPAGQDQRISFTSGNEPVSGADVRLECLQSVQGETPNRLVEGNPCPGAGSGMSCSDFRPGGQPCEDPSTQGCMFCEPNTRTCRLQCENDSDCLAENLGGFRCPNGEEATTLGLSEPVCVNPTCGELNPSTGGGQGGSPDGGMSSMDGG